MEQRKDPVWMRIRRFIDNEARLSRKQVAINMGKSESYISLILSGKRRIDIDEYQKICEVLAVPPTRFLEN